MEGEREAGVGELRSALLARLHAHARRASVAADEALQFGEPGATEDLLREIDTVLLLSKQATGVELSELEARDLAEHLTANRRSA